MNKAVVLACFGIVLACQQASRYRVRRRAEEAHRLFQNWREDHSAVGFGHPSFTTRAAGTLILLSKALEYFPGDEILRRKKETLESELGVGIDGS
ncbi:MAG TPA: hypothetical protein VJJ22_04075 [Candidatus Paceibacterota bacterium]